MKFCAFALVLLCATMVLSHPHPPRDGPNNGPEGNKHGEHGHHGGGRHHRRPSAPFDFTTIRQCRACKFSAGEVFCTTDGFKFDSDGVCQASAAPCNGTAIVDLVGCPSDVPRSKSSCTACVLDGYVWSSSPDTTSEYAGKCIAPEDVPAMPEPNPNMPLPPSDPTPPTTPDPALVDPPANVPPPPPAYAPINPPSESTAPTAPPSEYSPPTAPPSDSTPPTAPPATAPPPPADNDDDAMRPQHRRHGDWNDGNHDMPHPHHRPSTVYSTSVEQCQAFSLNAEVPSDFGWGNHHKHHKILRIVHHVVFAVALVVVLLVVVRCIRKRRCRRSHRHQSQGIPMSSPATFVEVQPPTQPQPQPQPQPTAPVLPVSAPPAPLPSYVYPGNVPVSVPYAAYYPVNQYPVAAAPVQPAQPEHAPVYPAMSGRVGRNGYLPVAQNDS